MITIISSVVTGLLVGFLFYVSRKPASFHYSASALFKAPPEKLFPYLSQLKKGGEWSPYERRDASMKKVFTGTDGAVGSKLDFDGNKNVGAGSVEILGLVPNRETKLRLFMTRPMKADHLIYYRLEPVGNETRFTWSMEGENGFLGKLFTTIIDCDRMMKKDMNEGFENLRKLVE